MDYGAAIWGYPRVLMHNISAKIVHADSFMGIGKYAPNLAVNGDMGWKPPIVRQWERILCQWNRCAIMDDGSLNKKVFRWSFQAARIAPKLDIQSL